MKKKNEHLVNLSISILCVLMVIEKETTFLTLQKNV